MTFIFVHTGLFIVSIYLSYLFWDLVQDDNNQYCTVETEHGRIRGKLNRTLFDGKLFYSFRGIPFAKPPLGELRFKVFSKSNAQIYQYFNTIGKCFFFHVFYRLL